MVITVAIEPLGSIMSVQAQGAVPAKPQKAAEVQQTADDLTVQAVEKVDKTISAVENAQGKGQNNTNTHTNQEQDQNQNEKLRKAVEGLNRKMVDSEAIFGFHEGTNRVMIKIVDRNTKETIKELPPEKTLDMIAKVWELAGIMVDEKR